MNFHNPLQDREIKSCPIRFCAEEWLKDIGQIFGGNAGTGVRDIDFALRILAPATNQKTPFRGKSKQGVFN